MSRRRNYPILPHGMRGLLGHEKVGFVPFEFTLDHGSRAQRRFVEREMRRRAAKSQSRRDGCR